MIIGKAFTFDSSHQLPAEECYGKCQNLHGHTYKLEIKISGQINEKGWLINFSDIKKIINEKVIAILDHNHINNIIYLPTAENILQWIYEQIIFELPEEVNLYEMKLWETPTSFAEWNCNESK